MFAEDTAFIYGGSVNKDNIKDYLSSDSIDGVLIGSASLDKNSIEEMLNTLMTINNLVILGQQQLKNAF